MKTTKKFIKSLTLTFVAVFLSSCGSTKDIAYFQNSDNVDLAKSKILYDARIMPKDELSITVSTTSEDAAVPFNMTVPTLITKGQSLSASTAQLQSFLVDNEGNVDFPRIGKVHLGGLTKSEAERLIYEKIRPYMNEQEHPIVTVRMSNYKISVLGEVTTPGMYTVTNEKVNVLEALAMAGDMTIYGVRDNVKLLREDAQGQKSIHILNLNDANIINSPYYYLQQNDVVYVEPNKVKAQNSSVGSMTSIWFSATSILLSVATMVINLVN